MRAYKPDSEQRQLTDRYARLSCAVVLVQSEKEFGTGFFIDGDGTLATAAHVIFDKTWTRQGDQPVLSLTRKQKLRIVMKDGTIHPFTVDGDNAQAKHDAGFDLAEVKIPDLPPTCYIRPNTDASLPPIGTHVIMIGYPGYSLGAQILYEGFISGIFPAGGTPVGFIDAHPDRAVVLDIRISSTSITGNTWGHLVHR